MRKTVEFLADIVNKFIEFMKGVYFFDEFNLFDITVAILILSQIFRLIFFSLGDISIIAKNLNKRSKESSDIGNDIREKEVVESYKEKR